MSRVRNYRRKFGCHGWPVLRCRAATCLLVHSRLARVARIALVIGGALTTCQTRADEPFRPFLDGLRRRGLHDVALDYLDWARTSPLIAPEVQQTVPYEAGLTLIEQARRNRDPARRVALLDDARSRLEQFVQAAPDHELAAPARVQLGNVLVERARVLVDRAHRPQESAQQEQHLSAARELLAEAQQVFQAAETQFQTRLDSFGRATDEKDRQKNEARRQARLHLMETKLYVAQVWYELGHTFPPGSEDFRKHLEQGADRYRQFYEQYRRVVGGLQARMFQARCLQDLGQTKQALAYYEEILAQPDDKEEFRVLKGKTLRLAMQCWTSTEAPQWEEAIRRGRAWIEQARDDEDRSPEGLAIRWYLALAAERRAQEVAEQDPLRAKYAALALEQAALVARAPGDDQQAAKEMVAKLRGVAVSTEPTTFAEARDQGKAALDDLELLLARPPAAAPAPAAETPERTAWRTQGAELRARAAARFRRALELRDEDTSLDEVNQVRYFLCYLRYQAAAYWDAAVLGEFLARRYPDSAVGRPAAGIAMAALVQLYNAAPPEARQFETGRMVQLAEWVTSRWPQEPDADRAWLILADMAVRSREFARAVDYLSKIPETSPRRGEADLKAGQTLWSEYLATARQASPTAPDTQQTDRRAQALAFLSRGVEAARKSTAAPDYALLAAELSLAQAHIESSDYAAALVLLERADSGPLALVSARASVAEQPGFAVETYKATLQAYVGSQQLDKAEATLAALEARVAGDESGAAQLTRIYVNLGRELEAQVTRLRTAGDQAALTRVLDSFKKFLDKIAARESGLNFNTLHWVAETYLGMASGLSTDDKPSAEAQNYLHKADAIYARLLTEIERNPDFAPAGGDVATALVLRRARCQRQMGQPDQAIELLVAVLKVRPATLEAQLEAARTYQAWGSQDPRRYTSAIQGDRQAKKKDGSLVNIVWGWRKLVAVLQGNANYRDIYYDAYFQLAQCSYLLAQAAQGQEQTRALQATRAVIEQLARTDPDMGGTTSAAQFDRLLKEVQRALGLPVTGVGGLHAPATPQAANS